MIPVQNKQKTWYILVLSKLFYDYIINAIIISLNWLYRTYNKQ